MNTMIQINVYHILIAFAMGGVMTLMAVGLGGFLVFRTRRDSHESLFALKSPKGDAFVVDPIAETFGDEEPKDAVPDILRKQTDRFMEQLKKEDNNA